MEDVYDLIKNVEQVYDSNTSFQVLKDFERVLEELDIYVFTDLHTHTHKRTRKGKHTHTLSSQPSVLPK